MALPHEETDPPQSDRDPNQSPQPFGSDSFGSSELIEQLLATGHPGSAGLPKPQPIPPEPSTEPMRSRVESPEPTRSATASVPTPAPESPTLDDSVQGDAERGVDPISASDWGFEPKRSGFHWETKVGVAMIAMLLSAFGFVVYRKVVDRNDNAIYAEAEPTGPATSASPEANVATVDLGTPDTVDSDSPEQTDVAEPPTTFSSEPPAFDVAAFSEPTEPAPVEPAEPTVPDFGPEPPEPAVADGSTPNLEPAIVTAEPPSDPFPALFDDATGETTEPAPEPVFPEPPPVAVPEPTVGTEPGPAPLDFENPTEPVAVSENSESSEAVVDPFAPAPVPEPPVMTANTEPVVPIEPVPVADAEPTFPAFPEEPADPEPAAAPAPVAITPPAPIDAATPPTPDLSAPDPAPVTAATEPEPEAPAFDTAEPTVTAMPLEPVPATEPTPVPPVPITEPIPVADIPEDTTENEPAEPQLPDLATSDEPTSDPFPILPDVTAEAPPITTPTPEPVEPVVITPQPSPEPPQPEIVQVGGENSILSPAPSGDSDGKTGGVPEKSTPEKARETVYEVRPGDNYWRISKTVYGTPIYFMALHKHNEGRIPNPQQMRPGMKIACPAAETLETRYPKSFPPGTLVDRGAKPKAAPEGKAGFFVDNKGPAYRVGPNDTLTDIAHRHLGRASRWVQIYEMNRQNLPNPDRVQIGTVIRLPADASQISVAPKGNGIR